MRTARFLAACLALVFAACGSDPESRQDPNGQAAQKDQRSATAVLAPTENNAAEGTVTFDEGEIGVSVNATITGLAAGRHGFHIHERGDCSAPDGSSAGGHYNPDGSPHGPPDAPADQRHAGDLGNISAGPDGVAQYKKEDRVITLRGDKSIVGKAVIVHEGMDDFTTQPTGAAGKRLACGVIGP